MSQINLVIDIKKGKIALMRAFRIVYVHLFQVQDQVLQV